jgi:hypothetical protein
MELEGPWTTHRREKRRRLDRLDLAPGSKIVDMERVDEVLSSLIQPMTGSLLKETTRSRPTFWLRSWRMQTRNDSTIFTSSSLP